MRTEVQIVEGVVSVAFECDCGKTQRIDLPDLGELVVRIPEARSTDLAGQSRPKLVPLPTTERDARELGAFDRQVLSEMARGATDREIADALNASLSSVHYSVRKLIRLFGARNRTGAAAEAGRRGLVVLSQSDVGD